MSEPIPTATKCALYTPTTEQVREEFATRMSPAMDATRRPAFDRWLAYHDAQVRRVAKVEALREAADELELPGSRATGYYASESDAGYREAETDAEQWLNDRADKLEQEGET